MSGKSINTIARRQRVLSKGLDVGPVLDRMEDRLLMTAVTETAEIWLAAIFPQTNPPLTVIELQGTADGGGLFTNTYAAMGGPSDPVRIHTVGVNQIVGYTQGNGFVVSPLSSSNAVYVIFALEGDATPTSPSSADAVFNTGRAVVISVDPSATTFDPRRPSTWQFDAGMANVLAIYDLGNRQDVTQGTNGDVIGTPSNPVIPGSLTNFSAINLVSDALSQGIFVFDYQGNGPAHPASAGQDFHENINPDGVPGSEGLVLFTQQTNPSFADGFTASDEVTLNSIFNSLLGNNFSDNTGPLTSLQFSTNGDFYNEFGLSVNPVSILPEPVAAIGDYVWLDKDADGIQDGDEVGIPNVTVKLLSAAGAELASMVTDANGKYLFSNLTPGDYKIQFVAPSGLIASDANQGLNDAVDSDGEGVSLITVPTTLVAGETDLTWDQGFYELAEIGDYVWEDKNADGKQDGTEPGIENVKVELYNCLAPDVVVATQFTDAAGKYLFTGLKPGTYHVKFYTPTGYFLTTQDVGGDDAIDSDANILTGQTICTTLESGESDKTWDAGMYKKAELGDYVWEDKNADGKQDGTEPGIENVKVELYNCANPDVVIATQFTDVNGKYLFTNLTPGTYHVKFTTPAGYITTTQDVIGSDALDSDANVLTGQTICTTLESGESDLTWDAGYYKLAEIGDYVWEDKNADGKQDGTEPGIENVKVELYNCENLDVVIATQFTDVNGKYLFTGLKPGTYHVKFTTPAGYVITTQDVGGDDAIDSDANVLTGQTICTTLESGESDKTWDAGMYKPAELGDYVWEDKNVDGKQDGNEPGIGNVKVELYNCENPDVVVATQFTDADGKYLFTNLKPGTYHVKFYTPTGYFLTTQDVLGSDELDSDANVLTGQTVCTVLESGESDKTWDAGMFRKAALGDYVWFDADHDGQQDGNEAGVANVTVHLLNTSDVIIGTKLTDANGFYLFGDLMPGDYKVQFILPGGFTGFTVKDTGSDATDSDADLTTGKTGVYNLESGETDLTVDAGVYLVVSTNPKIDIEKLVCVEDEPANCDCDEDPDDCDGGEGLTPGYWKQSHHFDDWTTYTPNMNYNAVFGVNDDPSLTLLGALSRGGGENEALGRHAVAALLNAAHAGVDYEFTIAQIIAMVQQAYANDSYEGVKNDFAQENELGASFNNDDSDCETDGHTGNCDDDGGCDTCEDDEDCVPVDADTAGEAVSANLGDTVKFTYVVTNPGDVEILNVVVKDDNATPGNLADDFFPTATLTLDGYNVGDLDKDNRLDTNEAWLYTASIVATTAGLHTNLGTVTGNSSDGQNVTDNDPANYIVAGFNPDIDLEKYVAPYVDGSTGGGTEGFTPGYWKQSHHFDDWTNYSPNMNYNAVFGVNDSSGMTLLGALGRGGGANEALGRHAVAALLNAAHANVDYAFTEAQVIAMVQQAYATGNFENAKDILANENEKGGNMSTGGGGATGGSTGIGSDADTTATAPTVKVGDKVVFTYLVKNTGDVELSNVTVKDDNGTPGNTADDFLATAVTSGGFNVGDIDKDGKLDLSETWKFTACRTMTTAGTYTNVATVTGTSPDAQVVTDEDPANVIVVQPAAPKSTISGFVYKECDNDGKKESGENGISGVTIKLTGTDKFGNAVSKTTTTDANGFYKFENLVEGTYKLCETQPAGYADGKDSAGTSGGTVSNDMISAINLAAGVNAQNYNFAELGTSALTGYVYADKDNDGKKENGEGGISGIKITLTGKDDLGNNICIVTYTDANGFYKFEGLRAGCYAIAAAQSSAYNDGKESVGSLGGCVGADKITSIYLDFCETGCNYNFGERPKTNNWC